MPLPPFQNIIVLVDGTDSAVKAANWAIQLARASSVQLTALCVVDTDTLRKLMSARILVEQEVAEFEAELERSRQRHLDQIIQMAKKAGVTLEMAMRKGVTHAVVLAEQKARKTDLIVIGGFRCSVGKHDLVARERQTIVDEAPCTVVVVK